jgi:hypothetical protein
MLTPKWSKYIPADIKPMPKQAAVLSLSNKEILMHGSGGSSKALSLDTEVPTPDGWSTVGQLTVGDKIFDQDGNITTIVDETFPPTTKVYMLTFSNGERIVCDANHLWSVFSYRDRERKKKRGIGYRDRRKTSRKDTPINLGTQVRNYGRKETVSLADVEPQVLTTQELVDNFWFREGSDWQQPNWSLPIRSSLNLPDVGLPIDPYVFGVWLGDGTASGGSITVWEKEDFIVDEMLRRGVDCNRSQNCAVVVNIRGIMSVLRKMDVLNNKHIPLQYLRASTSQRIELLQGLMDTDGSCKKESGACTFSTSIPRLRDDFCELLSSLAIEFSITETEPYYLNKESERVYGKTSYRIAFSTDYQAFKLQRKLERQNRSLKPRTKQVYVTGFEELNEPVVMKCFRVDSPHSTFLVGRKMIVTHNSWTLYMD